MSVVDLSFTAMPNSRSRSEWRTLFLEEIAAAANILEKDAIEGDAQRRLPAASLEFLKNSSLRYLKYPAVLGGAEADNALQFEIYEQLAYHNSAAAWCMFIYTDLIGLAAAYLPGAGFDTVFGQDLPLICGGGGMLLGDLTAVTGGYQVSGRWIYGSGIDGSDWVIFAAADKSKAGPPDVITCVVPRKDVTIIDNWYVLGMKGSGSSDFSADSLFVPEEMTYRRSEQSLIRGGSIFKLGMISYVAHTVPAVALGVARRAKDEAARIAKGKMRGYSPNRVPLAQRGVFQAFLGEADIKIQAARALMLENGLRIVSDVDRTGTASPQNDTEARAASYYVTRLAAEVVNDAVRFTGGDAVREGGRLEQAVRDVHMAGTHFCVSDTSLEGHAQFMMGIEGADPLA